MISTHAIRLAITASVLLLALTSCVERYEPSEGVDRTPLTIQVRRDVEVRPDSAPSQQREILYSDTSLIIRKGERFEMQEVGPEGACRVLYKGRRLDLSSCPWLPGFRDHEWDMYEIVNRE